MVGIDVLNVPGAVYADAGGHVDCILASLMSRRTGAMARYPLRQAHHVSYSVELTANRPPDTKTARFSICWTAKYIADDRRRATAP